MNKKTKRILINSLIVAGALCLVFFISFMGISIYKNAQFKKALPDAEAAPLMYYMNVTSNTSYFYNKENVSVLIPSLDYKSAYASSLADKQIDAVILKGSGELYVNMMNTLYDKITVGIIFYPSGMKKEHVELMKKVYPETLFVEADKEGRYIMGDYVFYFYGDKERIDTKIQYGLHSFLIADNAVGSMVDKVECDFALMPYESFKNSSIDADYVVFEEGTTVLTEDIMDKAMNYAIHPGYNFISLCMHRISSYGDELAFDITFTPTGRLEEK